MRYRFTSSIDTYVAAGAALLDVDDPNWYKKINVDDLSITNSNDCILGQLFGSYNAGCEILGFVIMGGDNRFLFGFNVVNESMDDTAKCYDKAEWEWKRQIRERLANV